MDGFDYFMDFLFLVDIVVNFRTFYFDERTNEPVKNQRLISKRYVFQGRFFLDLVASFPSDLVYLSAGGRLSKGTVKALSLLKLTRLLRLGRLITFIRFNKGFKHGLRVIILLLYLFLLLHWIACFGYYVYSIDKVWLPPKDIDRQFTLLYESKTRGYGIMFYYATLSLLGGDNLPTSSHEMAVAFFFVFMGTITLGLLIAAFSSLINDITKRAQ